MTKKKEETTEVAVHGAGNLPVVGADQFDLKDNMEGVDAQLPAIKIIHQGQLFTFPDESKQLSFTGTLIDMNRTNACWLKSFEEGGGGDPPVCFSLNGVTPDMSSEEVQSDTGLCANCIQNQFGSDGKRGKKCKNMKRIHVLIDGSVMPFRLVVSAANLKPVDLYVSLLTSQGVPYQLVETEFSLKKATNKDGIEYSELVMKNTGPTPIVQNKEGAMKLKALIGQWKNIMRGEQITNQEAV